MVQWPVRASNAIRYLFRPLQNIEVFVEDAGDEVFYRELLKRIAPKGVTVARVFGAGGRGEVIDKASRHYEGDPPAFYLIDGDLEWVRGDDPPACPRLHRLNAYCIENLIIDPRAIISILAEEEAITEEEASARLGFEIWQREITDPLADLFVEFALLSLFAPFERTTSLGVGSIINTRKKGSLPKIDRGKIAKLQKELRHKASAATNKTDFEKTVERITLRVGSLPNRLHAASGKDFVLPLLEFRLWHCTKSRCTRKSLRIRLAKKCSVVPFADVAAALSRVAKI